MNGDNGRTPPQSIEAEACCIGTAIISQEAGAREYLMEALQPHHFFRPSHITIWAAIRAMAAEGMPMHEMSVIQRLRQDGKLEEVGSETYLDDICQGVPMYDLKNARYYAGLVLQAAAKRNLAQLGERLAQEAFDATTSPAELVASLLLEAQAVSASCEGRREATAVITRLEDVEAKPIQWVWEGKIALGALTIWASDPGVGKSTTAIDLAARISTGRCMPDGTPGCSGGVVLLTAEDSLATTIKPRLLAAGADCCRVHALEAVKHIDEDGMAYEALPDLKRDLPAVEEAIDGCHECRLVIVDTVTAYMPSTDSHNVSEVRGLLAPLCKLAEKRNIAVLALTHLRKGEGTALHRIIGSIGFAGAARATFLLAKDPKDESGQRRLFLPGKNNLAPEGNGLAFRLEESPTYRIGNHRVSFVSWYADPVTTSADEALRTEDRRLESPQRNEAKDFLEDILSGGPMPFKDVEKAAREAGIHAGTLRRAKEDLGVKPTKAGMSGGWVWSLPGSLATVASDEDVHDQAHLQEPSLGTKIERTFEIERTFDSNKDLQQQKEAPAPEDAEDAHDPGTQQLRLNPDVPGDVKDLTPEQQATYKAIYVTRTGMSEAQRHAAAWRAALRQASLYRQVHDGATGIAAAVL